MRDNDLMALVRRELLAGLVMQGFNGVNVWQSYQPTVQGLSSVMTLYLHKITDSPTGSPGHREVWDQGAQVLRRITTEVMLTSYQISGSMVYDDTDPNAVTPADLVKAAARAVRSPEFQSAIIAGGANITRIGTVNNTPISGDTAGYEHRPMFDIQFNHTDVYTTEIPAVESTHWRSGRV
ncbi:phage gateway protein [Pectobacterium polaris]|uniref:phage gateway protein n=1 Tax=Pectobacterium polaris TaxID=2042057 RepID=UPI00202D8987|nr:hypothetical protein [Pectobacterium polaris]MCL6323992.1 hypothetical protein [Pectobacterium polaris]